MRNTTKDDVIRVNDINLNDIKFDTINFNLISVEVKVLNLTRL